MTEQEINKVKFWGEKTHLVILFILFILFLRVEQLETQQTSFTRTVEVLFDQI